MIPFDQFEEFNIIWNDFSSKYNIEQSKREVFYVWRILKAIKPKIMIEIGVAQGGSAVLWENASQDSKLFLIDLDFANFKKPLREGKDFPFRDSTNPETFKTIKTLLQGENVQFLFIDGAHDEPIVRSDYDLYGSLVREGIIVFHDVNSCAGVRNVWNSICYEDNINQFKNESKMFVLFPREENLKVTPQFLGIGIIFRNINL